MLEAVLFGEFDVDKGPIISHQYPPWFITPDLQQTLDKLIIPKPSLYNKKMCFSFANILFIGHPICIENRRYKRNQLIFNMVFAVRKQQGRAIVAPYVIALEKLARRLQQMEIETGYIWMQSTQFSSSSQSSTGLQPNAPPTSEFSSLLTLSKYAILIPELLERIFTEFHRPKKQLTLYMDPCNVFTIRLTDPPARQLCPPIRWYEVPVLLHAVIADCTQSEIFDSLTHNNLAVSVLLSCIDGTLPVPALSQVTGMTVIQVQQALVHLQMLGWVAMVDIFQFSNSYVVRNKISDFTSYGPSTVGTKRQNRAFMYEYIFSSNVTVTPKSYPPPPKNISASIPTNSAEHIPQSPIPLRRHSVEFSGGSSLGPLHKEPTSGAGVGAGAGAIAGGGNREGNSGATNMSGGGQHTAIVGGEYYGVGFQAVNVSLSGSVIYEEKLDALLWWFGKWTPTTLKTVEELWGDLPGNTDIKTAIHFGVIHGILRRVHEWPIFPQPSMLDEFISAAVPVGLSKDVWNILHTQISHAQCMDGVCLATQMSREEVLRILQPWIESKKCYIVWK